MELPRQISGKESACQCRRCGFDPLVGKIPCRRKWQPTQVFLPRKFHAQRSLVGYNQWGCKESDITEHTPVKAFEMNIFESSQRSCWTARVWRSQVSWVEVKGLLLCAPLFLLFPWTPVMKIHVSAAKKNTEILQKNVRKYWPAGTSTCCAIGFFDAWRYVYVCVLCIWYIWWIFFPL